MKNDTSLTEASRRYAAAHAAYFETKDLRDALEHYRGVLAAHSESQEVRYIEGGVPEGELLEAEVGLATARVGGDRQQERRIPVTPTGKARA